MRRIVTKYGAEVLVEEATDVAKEVEKAMTEKKKARKSRAKAELDEAEQDDSDREVI